MKKIAIFTEGQSEVIFIRHILTQLIGYEYASFECLELRSEILQTIPYKHTPPNALIHYQIINVGTDEKVLSAIIERHEKFESAGYEIIGLRDMYSAAYKKKSTQIEDGLNQYFIKKTKEAIDALNKAELIRFFFAIMEIEAWLLGFHENISRLNDDLTPENILSKTGINIQIVDPEITFFQPASQLRQILNIAEINYGKHKEDIERIVSGITLKDIETLIKENRCNSFALLVSELERSFLEATKG